MNEFSDNQRLPVIIVHGGAWAIPVALWERSRSGVARAANEGFTALEEGGSALDAVERAVRVLEADPVFDAGTGSVLNEEGQVEMDAMIMDGKNLGVGAVAAVQNVEHPVSLARRVMDKTPHCLLVGNGANKFALAQGFPLVGPQTLVTAEARADFEAMRKYKQSVNVHFRHHPQSQGPAGEALGGGKRGEKVTCEVQTKSDGSEDGGSMSQQQQQQQQQQAAPSSAAAEAESAASKTGNESWHDTVGAVAMDKWGNLAAATSTGGITMKMAGRVGDSPLVGAGAYADNEMGGASTTGHGESITKVLLAHAVLRAIGTQQPPTTNGSQPPIPTETTSTASSASTAALATTPAEACRRALETMHRRVGGSGGVVCLGADGTPGLGHTTAKMPWAVCQRQQRSGIPPVHSSTPSSSSSSSSSSPDEARCAAEVPSRSTPSCATGCGGEHTSLRLLRCGMDSSEAPPDLCVAPFL